MQFFSVAWAAVLIMAVVGTKCSAEIKAEALALLPHISSTAAVACLVEVRPFAPATPAPAEAESFEVCVDSAPAGIVGPIEQTSQLAGLVARFAAACD